jgi:hypothetical protein
LDVLALLKPFSGVPKDKATFACGHVTVVEIVARPERMQVSCFEGFRGFWLFWMFSLSRESRKIN